MATYSEDAGLFRWRLETWLNSFDAISELVCVIEPGPFSRELVMVRAEMKISGQDFGIMVALPDKVEAWDYVERQIKNKVEYALRKRSGEQAIESAIEDLDTD